MLENIFNSVSFGSRKLNLDVTATVCRMGIDLKALGLDESRIFSAIENNVTKRFLREFSDQVQVTDLKKVDSIVDSLQKMNQYPLAHSKIMKDLERIPLTSDSIEPLISIICTAEMTRSCESSIFKTSAHSRLIQNAIRFILRNPNQLLQFSLDASDPSS
jgi:hypothetical protein